MYGGGWLEGQRVRIVKGRLSLVEGSITDTNTFEGCGVIEQVFDDAYDTDRPTGYERIYLEVKLDNGRTVTVDAGHCKRI